jgi:chemotaxis protein methyltransferase CheR
MINITPPEFDNFSKYIRKISGISLDKGKEYLIETRLNPLMEENQCKNYNELLQASIRDKSIEKKVVDAISTNETYFFRDNSPFELLQHKIIPDLIDLKTKSSNLNIKSPVRIRHWSAANSTGQEIYSIAMTFKELYLDPVKYNIQLLGTDISDAAIAQASYGKYNKFEVARGLPEAKLKKYFNPDGDYWRIKDEIRSMAMFRKMNLMEPFTGMGKFDIIFCRNVAIYFTPEFRKELYRKIAGCLEPNGYLIIGSTESLVNDTDLFEPKKYLKSVFYQLKSRK